MIVLKAILKIFFVFIALIALIGFSVYFSTSIQRFVALRVLHSIDKNSELKFIKLRWNTLILQGLKLTHKSIQLELDSLNCKASVLSFIQERCIEVDNCEIDGFKLHLKTLADVNAQDLACNSENNTCNIRGDQKGPEYQKQSNKKYSEESYPFANLLTKAITIRALKARGDIYLAEHQHISMKAHAFNIKPGSEGSIQCTLSSELGAFGKGHLSASFDVTQPDLASSRYLSVAGHLEGTFNPHIADLDPRFTTLHLNAKMQTQIYPLEFKFKTLEAYLTDAAAQNLLSFKMLQDLDVLLSKNINFKADLNGELFELIAQPMPLELLQPLISGLKISGHFEGCALRLVASESAFLLSGAHPIIFTDIAWDYKNTSVMEGVGAWIDFKLSYRPQILNDFSINLNKNAKKLILQSLRLGLTHSHGLDWIQLGSVKPLDIPLDGNWDCVLKEDGDLISINVKPFEMSLFAGALPSTIKLDAKVQPMTLFVRAHQGAAVLTMTPLKIQELNYLKDETAYLQNIDIALAPTVSIQPNKLLTLALENIILSTSGVQPAWANGSAKIQGDLCEKPRTLRAQWSWGIDLAQALGQPIFSAYNYLQSGYVDWQGQGSFSHCQGQADVKSSLRANKMHSLDNPANPVAFSLGIQGQWNQKEGLSGYMPITVQAKEGTSDLQAKVQQNQNGLWAIALDSNKIYFEDVLALINGFQSYKEKPPTLFENKINVESNPAQKAYKDPQQANAFTQNFSQPLWGKAKADIKINLDTVIQNNYALLRNFHGHCLIDPAQINVNKLEGIFAEAALQAQGTLNYCPKTPEATYYLNTSCEMADFNLEHFLRSVKPSMRSPVVGLFNVSANLVSQGIDMKTLINQIQGSISIVSNLGSLHILDPAGKKAQAGSAVVGIVNAVAGNSIGHINTINQAIQLLQKIDYTQLRVEASRGPDLNGILSCIIVQSDELQLLGSGAVTYQENVDIVDQPLLITASIDAKNSAAKIFQAIHLLSSSVDVAGYSKGPKFDITGSMAKPNFSQLNSMLKKAAVSTVTGTDNDGFINSSAETARNALKNFKNLLGI